MLRWYWERRIKYKVRILIVCEVCSLFWIYWLYWEERSLINVVKIIFMKLGIFFLEMKLC